MRKLENDHLSIGIQERGAELISVFNKKTQTEHLWNANSSFWEWHAPVLFPVVGRCLNDEIIVDGMAYKMPKHGFARHSIFTLLNADKETALFSLSSSTETRQYYPYEFEFLIGYTLKEDVLNCHFEVRNTDSRTIYFQLGGHPAFAVPFSGKEIYENYYVQFETNENLNRYFISKEGFFNGLQEKTVSDTDKIPLTKELFKDDALIFKDLKSGKVSLRNQTNSRFLEVTFPQFTYLGLWAKEGAPFVCIEPWLGCADTENYQVEFSEREGVISLESSGRFKTYFTIKCG